jgi:Zn-dependent protease with chaperone function
MYHDALYSAYHYSHPTLTERLTALEKVVALVKKGE